MQSLSAEEAGPDAGSNQLPFYETYLQTALASAFALPAIRASPAGTGAH